MIQFFQPISIAVIISLVIPYLGLAQGHLSTDAPILGFSKQSSTIQRKHELIGLQNISEDSLKKFLKEITFEPHHAGSIGGFRSAQYVQQKLKEYGFDSRLVEYEVLLPYPLEINITMLEPQEQELRIREQTEFHPDALLPFNAYSPSGDVSGKLVYANYGFAEDYATLRELGIDVKGKIVLARYGRGYRGLKVRDATEAGAIAVILYSDPIDDGYMAGDIYPEGPMRPWDAVQRGSIRFSEHYPGDPLTPGYPAKKNAVRISIDEDPDMPRIPCTPISYNDAQHLLRLLKGPVVPRPWQGGLPFTYHTGPGPTKVRMKITMEFKIRTIWNNIALLRGTEEPEKKIILGGHRDPWVFGAQDPNSGTAVLLETARAIGAAVKHGWKPKRTIVLAQWDGEEYGMLGSTEWGEEFRDDLRRNAVVYMNFDGSVSGPNFGASASPSLDRFIQSITKEINDPVEGISVFSKWWRNQNKNILISVDTPLPENVNTQVGRMGGGSDHVVFLNHIGIPSMGFSFAGSSGIYHSYYDNFDWMNRFGDPGFRYHGTATRIALLSAMRFANAETLPFVFTPYAEEISKQLEAIEKRLHEMITPDPSLLLTLIDKTANWKQKTMALDTVLHITTLPSTREKEVNQTLLDLERIFVPEEGIAGREWYKHRVVVASGYASIGLPGISGAIDSKDWSLLNKEIQLFDSILDKIMAKTDELFAKIK